MQHFYGVELLNLIIKTNKYGQIRFKNINICANLIYFLFWLVESKAWGFWTFINPVDVDWPPVNAVNSVDNSWRPVSLVDVNCLSLNPADIHWPPVNPVAVRWPPVNSPDVCWPPANPADVRRLPVNPVNVDGSPVTSMNVGELLLKSFDVFWSSADVAWPPGTVIDMWWLLCDGFNEVLSTSEMFRFSRSKTFFLHVGMYGEKNFPRWCESRVINNINSLCFEMFCKSISYSS